LKEKIRADIKQASKWYDEHVFDEIGYENPVPFKQKIVDIILKYHPALKNKKLLDIACGNGNFLQFAESFFQTYGVDFSKNAIAIAKKRCKKSVLSVSPAEKLKFPNGWFDVITCLGSLEHFVNMDAALDEMARVVKPGGIAVIHVPNSAYLVHKMLRVKDHGQINERMMTEPEWRAVIEKHLRVVKCYKYNTRWYTQLIPKKYSCHFTFLCEK